MKKILTSNGKILTENGKILTANVESGGGLIEVTELPEVGKANTVYKLIHKNVGTVVPTTGLIENVYLNTSLSIDEVVSLLKPLTYSTDSNIDGTEALVVVQTIDKMLNIYKSVDKDDYTIIQFDSLTPTILFISADYSSVNSAYNFVGWNPTLANPRVVNQESTFTDDFVPQNDKLTDLFSITPFEEEKIPSEMYYLYKENEWVQISGGIVEVDKLPTSGEDNYVYKLSQQQTYEAYIIMEGQIFNVVEALAMQGINFTLIVVDELPTENIQETTVYENQYVYYVKGDKVYWYTSLVGDEGNPPQWSDYCEAEAQEMPYNGEVTSTSEMTSDGAYMLVTGGDSTNYYIYEKGEPTQVPNSGLIENLYFNTKLSIEEVDNILSQLTYDYDGYAYVVGAYEKGSSYGNIIIVEANAFTEGQIPSGYIIGHMHDTTDMTKTEFIYMSNQGLVDLALTLGINTKVGWNMETLNLNQTFNGAFGTENDKLINVISTTPYPRWTEISGGGATVKATPIAVPNSGYVERVYFNTKLTDAEIVATLDKLAELEGMTTLIWPMLLAYIDENNTVSISAMKAKFGDVDEKFWVIELIESSGEFNTIWSERSWNDGKNIINSGWSIGVNYIDINHEVVPEVKSDFDNGNIGNFNSEITNLFSLNGVFQEEEIELTESYDGNPLVLSNKYVKKTVVPNEGYVERVYFNTSLSIDEVKAIIEKFDTYYDGATLNNMIWLINIDDFDNPSVTPEKLYWIMPSIHSGDYAIVNGFTQVIFKSDSSKWAGGDFVGWNPEFITAEKPYLEINSEVFPIVTENGKETKIGGFNDELVDLFSLTPFEETIYDSVEVDIKEMLEEKKLPLEIKVNVESESVNVVKGGGTTVPNSGIVENVYFNTNLSVEEVVSLLSQLTYTDGQNPILINSSMTIALNIFNVTEGMVIQNMMDNTIYFSSTIEASNGFGADFVGWNTNITYPININDEVISNADGMNVGTENDKITSLFSTTPFENKVIKKLSGDYEAVDLTFNELPSVWKGTQVPNNEYVEDFYFNINLSIEEVDNILDRIDYTDNIYGIALVQESENTYLPLYVERGEKYGLSGYAIRYTASLFIFVSNQEIVDFISDNLGVTTKVGWNIENSLVSVYRDVVPSYQDNIYGTQNDKLTQLISIEAPLENTIDLEQYLDNKQMPMSVKVNVESQEPNLQEKEITENGEYVADEGYDGFSKVTVNVAGEDMLQARVDATNSCEYLFYQYKGDNVDFIKDLDTSNVTNMSSMFNGCSMLKTIPQLDTSNVTNMISMFNGCSMLETIPQLDMIKSTNRSQMFYNCSKLTNLTLLNIKAYVDLSQNEKLTLESLINTVKEFINVGSARILTMGTANLEKIASTYVKFTDSSVTTIPTNEKGDVVVCESTDEGAMLLKDYALLKNWTLA